MYNDRDTVLDNLAKLNFSEDEIVVFEDPTYNEINIFIREVALRTAKLTNENKNILVFFYYAGHGIQENTTSILLNEAEGKYTYNIEN